MTVDEFLARLKGVRQSGAGWTACCPGHEDREASLSVAAGQDGRVLLRCHAGCTIEAVMAALGLGMRDLFPARARAPRVTVIREGVYTVRDTTGTVIAEHVRDHLDDGRKRMWWRRPDGARGLGGLRARDLPLYGSDRLAEADPAGLVVVTEGEKATDALRARGIITVGTVTGARGTPSDETLRALVGRDVVLWTDADAPGRGHMARIASRLAGLGLTVRLYDPVPDVTDGRDAADDERDAETLRAALAAAPVWQPTAASAASEDGRTERPRGPSQAADLVALAADWGLWHTPDGTAYATIPVGEHREHHPLRSRAIRSALARAAYAATGRPARGEARSEALDVLEGRALYDGPEHAVHVRLAVHAGATYVDLGEPAWRAIEVTADGWRIVAEPPVRFRRPRALAPLPEPVRGGSLDALRAVLSLGDDEWRLMAAWLLAALRPRGPYPVLALHGEAGAGKSTAARVLRACTDPSAVPLRAEPRTAADVVIAATHTWIVAIDNVSRVQPWLSDALCRVATGGGYGARELYTNAEEVVIDVQRPVLLTGIEEVATRGDLADRTITVTLLQIADNARRPEAELWAAVEAMRPAVLGVLLDGVARALRDEATVRLPRLPRMADAARWVYAAAPGVGLDPDEVLAAWERQRGDAAATTVEASAVGQAVVGLLGEVPAWSGTATALLEALGSRVRDDVRRDRERWPRSGRGLSGALRRLAPALRTTGIDVQWPRRTETARTLSLCRAAGGGAIVSTVSTVRSPAGARDSADSHDGQADGRPSPTVSQDATPVLGADDHDGPDCRAGISREPGEDDCDVEEGYVP